MWRSGENGHRDIECRTTRLLLPFRAYRWSIQLTGDFDGDGKSDILWRDISGNVAIWEMNGTNVLNSSTSFVAKVSTNWSIIDLQ